MANSEKKTQYNIEYAKKNLKRVPLDLQLDKYEQVRTHASGRGETLNGFIKRAIDETIERDGSGDNAAAGGEV
jgi:hypothetical protein